MNMSDVQKEIASVEEFEKTLTFESPIPVSWAVWKYKAQQELIEQLQEREFNHYPIVIHDLESRIFAQQDLIAQKDAEIARLQKALISERDEALKWDGIGTISRINKVLKGAST